MPGVQGDTVSEGGDGDDAVNALALDRFDGGPAEVDVGGVDAGSGGVGG